MKLHDPTPEFAGSIVELDDTLCAPQAIRRKNVGLTDVLPSIRIRQRSRSLHRGCFQECIAARFTELDFVLGPSRNVIVRSVWFFGCDLHLGTKIIFLNVDRHQRLSSGPILC